MAKREFIEKQKAENITWQEPYYHDPINVCSEIRDKIRELPTFTEQDIVKPYLEKLIKKLEPIKECEYQIYGIEQWNFVGKCQDKIQDMIDNLLSEQGEIHCNCTDEEIEKSFVDDIGAVKDLLEQGELE